MAKKSKILAADESKAKGKKKSKNKEIAIEKELEKKIKGGETKKTTINLGETQEEREKKSVMWAGIAFFMILIIGFWFYNLHSVFELNRQKDSKQNFNWSELKQNFDESAGEMERIFSEIKKLQSEPATSTNPNNEEINALRNRLESQLNSATSSKELKQ